MKKFFIKKYIDKLTTLDIKNFADCNNILLNEIQINYIYNLVKNNWEKIFNNDDTPLFLLKDTCDSETYEKIKILYYEYKKKYSSYLN